MSCKEYELPKLDFEYGALEPFINKEIMELHYSKHHQAYVTNLNLALKELEIALESNDLNKILSLQSAIKFNGGGHLNHSLFWKMLAPKSSGGGICPEGKLKVALEKRWGSLQNFQDKFNAFVAPLQGSGWGWLGYSSISQDLVFHHTYNQDALQATTGIIPILGIDVWEHAYYLQYKNVRLAYLKQIWNVINWDYCSKVYEELLNN